MLLGRDPECAHIKAVVDSARHGRSSALVLRGEAGVGKTALLGYARAVAGGMRVLAATGAEPDAGLAFAGLADVVRPVLGHLDAIPPPQAAALLGALALGPPAAGDRFAICAGVLSLLAAASAELPLLVLIDDADRLDPSSAESLVFAARRLESDAVAVIASVRGNAPSVFTLVGLPELVVPGLDREAARAILGGPGPVSAETAERLYETTGGNPLALIELRGLLTRGQLAGSERLTGSLPSSIVHGVYSAEVERLAPDARRALVVAAAGESAGRPAVERACAAMGVGRAALEAAVDAGILRPDADGVRFRHPLLREAAYGAASTAVRRAAHRALAAGIPAGSEAALRAWHLAAAAADPDEDVAAALEEAAMAARLRGGLAVAASAFERAARLSPAAEERSRRLVHAASDRQALGEYDRSVLLLDEAGAMCADRAGRADIQLLRARAAMWQGAPMDAHAVLVREAGRIEADDPERAAWMLVEATVPCLMTWKLGPGEATARQAVRTAADVGGDAVTAAGLMLGHALALRGEMQAAASLLAHHGQRVEDEASPIAHGQLLGALVLPLIWWEQYDRARALLDRLIDEARALGAASALPRLLGFLSGLDFRTGRWASAYACAGESLRLALETSQESESAHALVCLARVESAQGRADECREHCARARELADRFGIAAVDITARSVSALLDLGIGQVEAAIEQFEEVAARLEHDGPSEPAVIGWEGNLVEACIRGGHRERAVEILGRMEARACRSRPAGPDAVVARCRGLLGTTEVAAVDFAAALRLHDRAGNPFERARTELCLGEHLRRTRRVIDARGHLAPALDVFVRLGADPWAQRARAELGASEPAQNRDPSAIRALTPQELQIALRVAAGATNREVGAAVFLSPKTVEAHLSRAYRKLGVRSRTELARLLAVEDMERAGNT